MQGRPPTVVRGIHIRPSGHQQARYVGMPPRCGGVQRGVEAAIRGVNLRAVSQQQTRGFHLPPRGRAVKRAIPAGIPRLRVRFGLQQEQGRRGMPVARRRMQGRRAVVSL